MPNSLSIKVGVISDTHGYLDPKVLHYFKECHEIWHLGDFGQGVSDVLKENFTLRGVYGNIDDLEVRNCFPEHLFFELQGLKILLIHIGGYPGKYSKKSNDLIHKYKPDLFLCGHSHVCKVMRDSKNYLLHINPGAAGNQGFHLMKTIMRFDLINGKISNLEAIELGLRQRSSAPK